MTDGINGHFETDYGWLEAMKRAVIERRRADAFFSYWCPMATDGVKPGSVNQGKPII